MHSTLVFNLSFLTKLLPDLNRIIGSGSNIAGFICFFVFELLRPSMLMGVANSDAVRIPMPLSEIQRVNATSRL
jgi:hypothetical protein